MDHTDPVQVAASLDERELAATLEALLPGLASNDWIAYEVPEMQEKYACTVGHFGDWVLGSESGVAGGNYRDDDTGDDRAHAHFCALVKNHAPKIIEALRAKATPGTGDALREAAEGASLAWRNWLAGCADNTRWKEVEAAHIRLRDALAETRPGVGTAPLRDEPDFVHTQRLEPSAICPKCRLQHFGGVPGFLCAAVHNDRQCDGILVAP